MPNKRRIAIMLGLQGAWRRHVDTFRGIKQYANERGDWDCIIDEFVPETLSMCKSEPLPYDGVIARATSRLAELAHQRQLPVVNTRFNSPAKDLPLVCPDFELCGQLCFDHLAERGFRRMGWMTLHGARDHNIQADKMKELCRRKGYEFQVLTFNRNHGTNASDWKKMHRLFENWLDKLIPPIGVVVAEVFLARILAQACVKRGLHVPQDVAIVVDLDEPNLNEKMNPRFSSLDAGYEWVGYEAARLLNQLMEGQPAPEEPVLVPNARITAHNSTDYFAVEDEIVAQALRYISDNIAKPLGVNEIASAISAAPRTLQRGFQEQLGRPVAAEVRRLRITKAQRLLTDPDISVKEIVEEVGFTDARGMCRIFQHELGLSPTEYRKEHLASTERKQALLPGRTLE